MIIYADNGRVSEKKSKLKGYNWDETIVIEINRTQQLADIAGVQSPIIEYGGIVKVPDGQVMMVEIDKLTSIIQYNYEKADFKAYVSLNSREYKISRKNPYGSEYTLWFYFKTPDCIITVILAKPLLYKASGIFVELGIAGHNYNQVYESISSTMNILSTPELRKQFEEEQKQSEKLKNDSVEPDIDADDNICDDYDEDEEDF
jgi:hypothetical protein